MCDCMQYKLGKESYVNNADSVAEFNVNLPCSSWCAVYRALMVSCKWLLYSRSEEDISFKLPINLLNQLWNILTESQPREDRDLKASE